MSKSSSKGQQTQRNDVFSLLPYAYHEAGHAVVGYAIGRLIALVSIKHASFPVARRPGRSPPSVL